MSKIFSAIIKNRIYDYLLQNNFIDQSTQKGFWSSISGTIEHTESLTYLLNNAENKQRGLILTLLNLQNPFGKVNYNFLPSVLKFDHLPDEIIHLINNLYSGYQISIVTNNFITPPITIEKGVLQGDSLSPLLSNLCFNTLMLMVNQERVKCLGYTSNTLNFIKHWSQFAGDTVIITSLESENQYLSDLFTKWCSWLDLIVKISKCMTFGIEKSSTAAVQFEPHLMISGQKTPTVKKGESFKYLGKGFNFGMNLHQIK